MYKLISSIILLTIFLSGCRTSTEPVPPEKKPLGYQEDVPWPSLADSPWPMEHHDPQYTGRSKFAGPSSFNVTKLIDVPDLQPGISIGEDSVVYIPSNFIFYAVDLLGKIKFQQSYGIYTLTTPIVKKGNKIVIYYESKSSIIEIDSSGQIIWRYKLNFNLSTQLGIDKAGNIYFVNEGILYVINNNGKLFWSLADEKLGGMASFSFSPDGSILYLSRNSGPTIIAIDLNQRKIIWTFGKSGYIDYPSLIDSDGNIYFSSEGDDNNTPGFYSVSPEGKVNWHFSHNMFYWHYANHTPPTMDKNGNIYFGQDTLYSFDIDGNLRWKKYIEHVSTPTPLICDAENNIYVTLGATGRWGIVKLNSNGNILLSTSDDAFVGETSAYSPVILDKMIVMPTQDKYVYLIK